MNRRKSRQFANLSLCPFSLGNFLSTAHVEAMINAKVIASRAECNTALFATPPDFGVLSSRGSVVRSFLAKGEFILLGI